MSLCLNRSLEPALRERDVEELNNDDCSEVFRLPILSVYASKLEAREDTAVGV